MTTQPKALQLADELYKFHSEFPTCTEAAAELRRLHAEVEALRSDFTALQKAIVGETGASAILTAQALRADAERYRWMKQEVKRIPLGWEMIGWDAAIDAAKGAAAEIGRNKA